MSNLMMMSSLMMAFVEAKFVIIDDTAHSLSLSLSLRQISRSVEVCDSQNCFLNFRKLYSHCHPKLLTEEHKNKILGAEGGEDMQESDRNCKRTVGSAFHCDQ